MHQPLIPAGGDLHSAPVISNLAWMMDHQDIGGNHNAPVFVRCYQRMGDFIRQLPGEGRQPRVMLDYSGTLLHGMRQMGLDDVFDALGYLTRDPRARQAVEWLGCTWGHAVAPSTPPQDFRLHVRAWQHHFAAIFGLEALGRVRGFSPAEMALPNHPDVACAFVRTLADCGYQWVLVQEHTVEQPDGRGIEHPHLPHRLVCTDSRGNTASIVAVVKTQGSDTKLVGQMQPYYEARSLHPDQLAGRPVAPVVTQIADGENGGVMMNEFPPKYFEVIRECSGSPTPAVNVTAYLEMLARLGIKDGDLPVLQPVLQHRVWERFQPGEGPGRLAAVIGELSAEDGRFSMDGGSWTSDVSWVRGYRNVLAPMGRGTGHQGSRDHRGRRASRTAVGGGSRDHGELAQPGLESGFGLMLPEPGSDPPGLRPSPGGGCHCGAGTGVHHRPHQCAAAQLSQRRVSRTGPGSFSADSDSPVSTGSSHSRPAVPGERVSLSLAVIASALAVTTVRASSSAGHAGKPRRPWPGPGRTVP